MTEPSAPCRSAGSEEEWRPPTRAVADRVLAEIRWPGGPTLLLVEAVRPETLGGVAALEQLGGELYHAKTASEVAVAAAEGLVLAVIDPAGTVVAARQVRPAHPMAPPGWAYLAGTVIHPSLRGQGLYGCLADEAHRWLHRRGVAGVFAVVHPLNVRSLAALLGRGYRLVRYLADHYGPGPEGQRVVAAATLPLRRIAPGCPARLRRLRPDLPGEPPLQRRWWLSSCHAHAAWPRLFEAGFVGWNVLTEKSVVVFRRQPPPQAWIGGGLG